MAEQTDPLVKALEARAHSTPLPDAPSLTAEQFLDLAIPGVKGPNDGTPSDSTVNNRYFTPVGYIHLHQFQTMFGDYGGYPSKMGIVEKFHPFNKLLHEPAVPKIEAQAVDLGRSHVLLPVAYVLQRKIPAKHKLQYDVEAHVETPEITLPGVGKQTFDGYVDAIYYIDNKELVLCEFKRSGCIKLDKWTVPSEGLLGTDAQKITKQLMKYAYATQRKYFILSDWNNWLFFHLPDINREQLLVHNRTGNARYLEAQGVHCDNASEFKVRVYAFVWNAYEKEYGNP